MSFSVTSAEEKIEIVDILHNQSMGKKGCHLSDSPFPDSIAISFLVNKMNVVLALQ